MNEELSPLEVSKQLKDFVLEFVKNGLDRRFIRGSFDIIDTALKNYEELTSKPVVLYGRTHGHTQALIDTICKNYKEVKITNLEDEKKVKALEIIKENVGLKISVDDNTGCLYVPIVKTFEPLEKNIVIVGFVQGQDKIDLLKEVLKDE